MPSPNAARLASHSPPGSTTVVDPYPEGTDAGTVWMADSHPHTPAATTSTRTTSVLAAVPPTDMVRSAPCTDASLRIRSENAGFPRRES